MTKHLKIIVFLTLAFFVVSFLYYLERAKEPEVITQTQVLYETLEVKAEPEEPYYTVTSVERELLARLVWAEARGEPIEAQEGVASVVFNRATSCGKSVSDIIYAVNSAGTPQFSTASMLKSVTPTEQQYEAVDKVIWNGPTMPSWVQYFRANYHHNWSSSYTPYCVYGNTYFGGFAG